MDAKGFGKRNGGTDIPLQKDAAGLGMKPGGASGLIGGVGTVAALVLALFLSGCVIGTVKDKVQGKVLSLLDEDLGKVVYLAEKYGEEDLAKCAKYLQGALAGKQELLGEETKGLLSRALKSKLLAQYVRDDETAFKEQCRDFSADIMLELGKGITGGR